MDDELVGEGGKGLQTTARRDGEDWVINGEKVFIPSIRFGTRLTRPIWTTNSCGWDDRGVISNVLCAATRNMEV